MSSAEWDRKKHWEKVYRDKLPGETSWYQSDPLLSLSMIEHTGFGPAGSLIDIGGGASLLVDHLLDLGYRDLTVLDVSRAALAQAASRLENRAARVDWLEADVTQFKPARHFTIWHDRAAFHFLTADSDRQRYRVALKAALTPGGQAIIATFAPGGPEKCSGLPIVRYDSPRLLKALGPGFVLLEQQDEVHITPAGREQLFRFFRLGKKA